MNNKYSPKFYLRVITFMTKEYHEPRRSLAWLTYDDGLLSKATLLEADRGQPL
jgi:hypothetical protein